MKLLGKAVVLLALACAYLPAAQSQRGVQVRFGIIDPRDGEFVETTIVPNVPGQSFGWVLTMTPVDEPVRWSEELSLPVPPREWRVDDDGRSVSISDDRKIALSRGVIEPYSGEFSHFWGVSPGDPPGVYNVVVKVSDGVVGEADLEFVDP